MFLMKSVVSNASVLRTHLSIPQLRSHLVRQEDPTRSLIRNLPSDLYGESINHRDSRENCKSAETER